MFFILQDVVDPVTDELLATFVVDSHHKSQPKGANRDDKSLSEAADAYGASMPADPEVLTQILLLLLILIQVNIYCVFWCVLTLKRCLACLQILPQELLKKYITYAKLNVFPRLQDADLDKLTHVYAELRRESSVMSCPFLPNFCLLFVLAFY